MNVRIDKPMKKGETRHGVLSREMNGVVCFDETDQQWLNNPTRRTVRLKRFPLGTRVSRKNSSLTIKLELPIDVFDTMQVINWGLELSDALSYAVSYAERRKK